MTDGFFRVAAASPAVTVADCNANVDNIIALASELVASSAPDLVVFPEMCVTAYTCGDLFHNRTLLDGAMRGLRRIVEDSATRPGQLLFAGMPVEADGALYNCAVAVCGGRVLAVIPKTYIPTYNEFYEKRWFSPAPPRGAKPDTVLLTGICPEPVPFGTDIIILHKGVRCGAEICEDLWTTIPPSSFLAGAGAEVIVNLSASDDLIGKYDYLLGLVRQQSARCLCAYVYSSAGFGESSTDLVFDAKLFVAENGTLLARNSRWHHGNQSVVSDVDIEALRRDRLHINSFQDCARRNGDASDVRVIESGAVTGEVRDALAYREVDPRPFVPSDAARRTERCEEIVNIQVAGLCKRLAATRCKSLVIGISGGLDSTLALLVAVRAFDTLGLPRTGITGVTMPGFGTTGRTHRNACTLMETLGVTMREISIVPSVELHFSDIGHDPAVQDVTYENCQARERTQILMDIANQTGGMVLGTGDLSELALGWATYNGDHMSMYGVNAGVPKTLVRHLTGYFALLEKDQACREALLDVIDTPISPELIPAAADGTIKQKTEDLVGPYELHDFFLYYTLRYGFTPDRIYLLARKAFAGEFDDETIKKWLKTFFRRFFAQQFKRSCLPDGPKVGSVCLSPRGDWRMPSDASNSTWLREAENL